MKKIILGLLLSVIVLFCIACSGEPGWKNIVDIDVEVKEETSSINTQSTVRPKVYNLTDKTIDSVEITMKVKLDVNGAKISTHTFEIKNIPAKTSHERTYYPFIGKYIDYEIVSVVIKQGGI